MKCSKVSVIMLTYNRESFIKKAIESILSQTFQDFELIVVDNGSSDRSGMIADEYAAKEAQVSVLHRARGTIGSGRNAGLDAACGEYITFIDDDDWCEPDFLEFLCNLVDRYTAEVAICGALKEEDGAITCVASEQESTQVMNAEEAILALMWRKRYNTGFPTKLIAKTLFQENRFDEEGQYDDISLMYKILAQAQVVVSSSQPKYHVRRHAGNNSMATTKDHFITPEYLAAYRKAYRERTEWLIQHFAHRTSDWLYFNWSFQLSMINKIISNNLVSCTHHLEEMRSEISQHREEFGSSPLILDSEKILLERHIR